MHLSTVKVTCKQVRPNSLIESWLIHMYEDSKIQKSSLEPMLKKAIESLAKYPLPLKSGAECMALNGFDKKLCAYLDKCLSKHNNNSASADDSKSKGDNFTPSCLDNSNSTPIIPCKKSRMCCRSTSLALDSLPDENLTKLPKSLSTGTDKLNLENLIIKPLGSTKNSAKGKRNTRIGDYKPAHRSGGYAILVALLEHELENSHECSLTKEKLIDKAQKHSEESFVRPKPDSFYTAWSNMTRLVKKELVTTVKKKKVEYMLTEKGKETARLVLEEAKSIPSVNDIIFNDMPSTSISNDIPSKSKNMDQNVDVIVLDDDDEDLPVNLGNKLTPDIMENLKYIATLGNRQQLAKLGTTKQPTTSGTVQQLSALGNILEPTTLATIQKPLLGKIQQLSATPTLGTAQQPTTLATTQQPATWDTIQQEPAMLGKNVIEMAPGTFDIILLIDKNETGGLKKKNDPTVVQFKKYADLKHEYRSLKVGDFTWVARHQVHKDQELVLPFIVERKRMDDLGASIKDGRFHEQKFRLRKCGLNNVIYLVENYGKNKHVGLPIQSLMQALANTRIQDGFKVHMTDSLTNSARFLAIMTKRLTIRYKDKHLRGCNADPQAEDLMTFEYFNKSSAKTRTLTVTETFIKLLLQLKGVSVEKALAITQKYPTPRSLINAYVKCSKKEGECLLMNLKYGDLNRNVGPMTSKSIYQLFSDCGSD